MSLWPGSRLTGGCWAPRTLVATLCHGQCPGRSRVVGAVGTCSRDSWRGGDFPGDTYIIATSLPSLHIHLQTLPLPHSRRWAAGRPPGFRPLQTQDVRVTFAD